MKLESTETVTKEFAEEEVGILAERIALLHYCFVDTLVQELGEEEAIAITQKAIERYGRIAGKQVEGKVIAMGLEPTLANYAKGRELPTLCWKKQPCDIPPGKPQGKAHRVDYCPFASTWKELDFERLGRLYCGVDQAKYSAYGKGHVCVHDKNLCDGDDCCIVRVERNEGEE